MTPVVPLTLTLTYPWASMPVARVAVDHQRRGVPVVPGGVGLVDPRVAGRA